MQQALQGFQLGNLSNVLVTVLAGWLVWPVICGILGSSKGMTMKGVMHGLVWGPIGILFVLMVKTKHPCPTCGCKTLDQPFHQLAANADGAAAVFPSLSSPEQSALPVARPTVAPSADITAPASNASQDTPADRRKPRPQPAEPRGDLRAVVEQACAGYSEAEAARLLAWVNDQAAAIANEIHKPGQPAQLQSAEQAPAA